jgi:hypothetical protein
LPDYSRILHFQWHRLERREHLCWHSLYPPPFNGRLLRMMSQPMDGF